MKRKPLNIQREDKILQLINAALKRYSHEELFAAFLDTITKWKDRESVAKIAAKDELLMDDVLFEFKHSKIPTDQLEAMKDALELNGYKVMKMLSLAEEIRFEQFEEELKVNPYQLQLIA